VKITLGGEKASSLLCQDPVSGKKFPAPTLTEQAQTRTVFRNRNPMWEQR
jgi:hypothetical protein